MYVVIVNLHIFRTRCVKFQKHSSALVNDASLSCASQQPISRSPDAM